MASVHRGEMSSCRSRAKQKGSRISRGPSSRSKRAAILEIATQYFGRDCTRSKWPTWRRSLIGSTSLTTLRVHATDLRYHCRSAGGREREFRAHHLRHDDFVVRARRCARGAFESRARVPAQPVIVSNRSSSSARPSAPMRSAPSRALAPARLELRGPRLTSGWSGAFRAASAPHARYPGLTTRLPLVRPRGDLALADVAAFMSALPRHRRADRSLDAVARPRAGEPRKRARPPAKAERSGRDRLRAPLSRRECHVCTSSGPLRLSSRGPRARRNGPQRRPRRHAPEGGSITHVEDRGGEP